MKFIFSPHTYYDKLNMTPRAVTPSPSTSSGQALSKSLRKRMRRSMLLGVKIASLYFISPPLADAMTGTQTLHAQQLVTVSGKAKGFEKKTISIYSYDDLITYKEVVRASTTVNDTGGFQLALTTATTQKMFLRVDNLKGHLFVAPGKNYSVGFLKPDAATFVNPSMTKMIDLSFHDLDSTDINARAIDFNAQTDDFWFKNYQYFVVNRGKQKLDSFSAAIQKKYAEVNDNFFQTHIRSTLASLDYGILQAQKNAPLTYFGKGVLQENNYEYMALFNSVFKQYVQKLCFRDDAKNLILELNDKANYAGTIREIKKMSRLTNDTLVELVLLKGLLDIYYVQPFDRGSIKTLLEYIKTNSATPHHKKIAQNILESLGKLDKGAIAPAFTLPDRAGKMVSLTDFKGKYVYLDFWASWCIPCLEEMKMMPSLKKKYGNQIVFVSISTDRTEEDMQRFLEKNPKYDWIFLYDIDKQIQPLYEIRAVPTCFLIDPDGKFYQSPAEKPSGEIEKVFNEIATPKKKKANVGEK